MVLLVHQAPKLGFDGLVTKLIISEEAKGLLIGNRTKMRGLFHPKIVKSLLDQVQLSLPHIANQPYSILIPKI